MQATILGLGTAVPSRLYDQAAIAGDPVAGRAGDRGVMPVFGPGLTSHGVVLRFGQP